MIEYVGEVIDRGEWEVRNGRASQHEAIYFMHLSHNLIIDAAHKGNVSRFINHSCSPNLQASRRCLPRSAPRQPAGELPASLSTQCPSPLCVPLSPAPLAPQVQKWFVNSQPRLAMFALRDIGAREELSYDYNVQWTGKWQSGQRCECGAPNCTGKMSAVAAHKKAGADKAKPKRKRRRPSLAKQQLAKLLAQPCRVCASTGDDESTLLCDSCDAAFHLHCLSPRLDAVPSGEWHCPGCASKAAALGEAAAASASTAAGKQSARPSAAR